MDPITIGMLAMGVLNTLGNKKKEEQTRFLSSVDQRLSPWLKGSPRQVEYADPWGDLSQTGAGVLGYQQGKEAADLRKRLVEAQIDAIEKGQSPNGFMMDGSNDLWGTEPNFLYGRKLGKRP